MLKVSQNGSNYKLISLNNGYKYEQIDKFIIKRSDVSATTNHKVNLEVDAYYDENQQQFILNDKINNAIDNLYYTYKDLKLQIKLNNQNHIGVFPEQRVHWDYVSNLIKNKKAVKVLNLFAYTGAATINAALSGASEVVHVDALKQINQLAKLNSKLSKSDNLNIRYISDDVIKFLKREIRRNNKYQVVIMDPPTFGRGPKNELWKFYQDIETLLTLVKQVLENPLAIIISVYTKDFTKVDPEKLLTKHFEANIKTYNLYLESEDQQLLAKGLGGICEF